MANTPPRYSAAAERYAAYVRLDNRAPRILYKLAYARYNERHAIEAIDAQIRQTGRDEHRRLQWSDRDPLHPRCLGYWARQFGSDGRQRLARLLRCASPSNVWSC